MKVYTRCTECREEITFSTFAPNRVEMAMRDGENKKLDCFSCHARITVPIDDIYTKKSTLINWMGLFLFIVGSALTFLFAYPLLYQTNNPYGIYVTSVPLLLPGVIYALLKKQDSDRVSKFNRHNLKGRVHNIGR